MLAAGLLAAGGTAAYADPPPWAHAHRQEPGVVSGVVTDVDFGGAVIVVDTGRGRVPIVVTPTTSIVRGSAYSPFAQLGRGSRVTVDVTELDGRLVAQIIRIH